MASLEWLFLIDAGQDNMVAICCIVAICCMSNNIWDLLWPYSQFTSTHFVPCAFIVRKREMAKERDYNSLQVSETSSVKTKQNQAKKKKIQ